jgi:hypothetical protein
MSAFHRSTFVEMLNRMTGAQESIETVRSYISLQEPYAKECAAVWKERIEMERNASRQLLYVYVLNDLLQTSKKVTDVFEVGFLPLLPSVFRAIYPSLKGNPAIIKKITRVFGIWEERRIVPVEFLEELGSVLRGETPSAQVDEADGQEGEGVGVGVGKAVGIKITEADIVEYAKKDVRVEWLHRLRDCLNEVISHAEENGNSANGITMESIAHLLDIAQANLDLRREFGDLLEKVLLRERSSLGKNEKRA